LTGHISVLIMYSGDTMGISHHKKNMTEVIHCLKFWKAGELGRILEWR